MASTLPVGALGSEYPPDYLEYRATVASPTHRLHKSVGQAAHGDGKYIQFRSGSFSSMASGYSSNEKRRDRTRTTRRSRIYPPGSSPVVRDLTSPTGVTGAYMRIESEDSWGSSGRRGSNSSSGSEGPDAELLNRAGKRWFFYSRAGPLDGTVRKFIGDPIPVQIIERQLTPPPPPPPVIEHLPSISSVSSTPLPSEHTPEHTPEPSIHEPIPEPSIASSSSDSLICMYLTREQQDEVRDYIEKGRRIPEAYGLYLPKTNQMRRVGAELRLSRKTPVFKLTDKANNRAVLMVMNTQARPSCHPADLDAFKEYTFKGTTIADLKKKPFAIVPVNTAREPFVFVFDTQTDAQEFCKIVAILQDATSKVSRQLYTKTDLVDPNDKSRRVTPPTLLHKAKPGHKKYPALSAEEIVKMPALEAQIARTSKLMVAQYSVSKYWKDCQDVWVTYRDPKSGKYKVDLMRVFIDYSSPFLVVADKHGDTLPGRMDYCSTDVSHRTLEELSKTLKLPSFLKKESHSPHAAVMTMAVPGGDKRIFSFETKDRLRNFTQVCAVLLHIQVSSLGDIRGDPVGDEMAERARSVIEEKIVEDIVEDIVEEVVGGFDTGAANKSDLLDD